jgi:hypothetical protein
MSSTTLQPYTAFQAYAEGYEAGESATLPAAVTARSEMWLRGFSDGQHGTWQPPDGAEDELVETH